MTWSAAKIPQLPHPDPFPPGEAILSGRARRARPALPRGQGEDSAPRLGGVRYDSGRVWCAARAQPAVVSVIERADAVPPLRFVRWCSLRALGACDERCLTTGRRRL